MASELSDGCEDWYLGETGPQLLVERLDHFVCETEDIIEWCQEHTSSIDTAPLQTLLFDLQATDYAQRKPRDDTLSRQFAVAIDVVRRFQARGLGLLKKVLLDLQSSAADPIDAAGGKGKWQTAQAYLEECRQRGEGFTSQDEFAQRIDCSVATVNKAIARGTVELQEWASKQRVASRKNAAPEVAAVVFENAPQTRETDPANMMHDCDADVVLAKLLDQVSPDERARINAMSPAEKRQLAETFNRDADKEEQDQRYAEVKKKRSRAD